jgi:hypothetical protein
LVGMFFPSLLPLSPPLSLLLLRCHFFPRSVLWPAVTHCHTLSPTVTHFHAQWPNLVSCRISFFAYKGVFAVCYQCAILLCSRAVEKAFLLFLRVSQTFHSK